MTENNMLTWISEGDRLPIIGQTVLLALPRQAGEFWDMKVGRLLVRHEGVAPLPVKAGGQWPVDYYWSLGHFGRETSLITGNGWWAMLDSLPLPPGAEHHHERGYHNVRQIGEVFIAPQRGDRP